MVSDGSRIRGQDDLTLKLQDILKQNRSIIQQLKNGTDISKVYELMQLHAATYMNHEARGYQLMVNKNNIRSNGPLRSLFFRLKGKKGRVRGNLMGKRCDFR